MTERNGAGLPASVRVLVRLQELVVAAAVEVVQHCDGGTLQRKAWIEFWFHNVVLQSNKLQDGLHKAGEPIIRSFHHGRCLDLSTACRSFHRSCGRSAGAGAAGFGGGSDD